MSFRDERVQAIAHDTILGQSMCRVKHKDHLEIAEAMAEREKRHSVTVVPIGHSGVFTKPDTTPQFNGSKASTEARQSKSRLMKAGTFGVDNSVNRAVVKAVSGHQNLVMRAEGCGVVVGSVNLGTFPKEQALKVRDSYRAKNGLPPAEY